MGGLSEILWQEQSSLPLLIWLQLIPLIGAAVVFAFKERSTAVIAGKVFALAELLLAIVVTSRINPTLPALQMAERFDLIAYHVAVDGLSLIFILLTAAHRSATRSSGMARS